jgi:hypothetical protein
MYRAKTDRCGLGIAKAQATAGADRVAARESRTDPQPLAA